MPAICTQSDALDNNAGSGHARCHRAQLGHLAADAKLEGGGGHVEKTPTRLGGPRGQFSSTDIKFLLYASS
jgi:hypothetical protein